MAEKILTEEPIKMPADYILQDPVPEGAGVPAALIYKLDSRLAAAELLCFAGPEERSLPFTSELSIVETVRRITKGTRTAIIEAGRGMSRTGMTYAYCITKHEYYEKGDAFTCMEYTLDMNIDFPDLNWFINGSFLETGSSIDRDAEVLESIARERFGSFDRAVEIWKRDPYDPELRDGLLMSYSDRAEFDERYPGHPLSKIRELVRFITRNN
jgi:hypothetical protein